MRGRGIRSLCVLLCVVMIVTMIPGQVAADGSDIVASGDCGERVHWSFHEDGTLEVYGIGSMADYQWEAVKPTPWYDYLHEINKIKIWDGVTRIGHYAFYWCDNVTSVELPATLSEIGIAGFGVCKSLAEITLPEGLRFIDGLAFAHCESLTNIVIPESVTCINDMVFTYCRGLERVDLPGGIDKIDRYLFNQCTSLTTITIPERVTEIGEYAFSSCESLTELTVPRSVERIGKKAFQWSGLETLTFQGSAPAFAEDVFYETTVTVRYPGGDESWTEQIRTDHGGALTWGPYAPEVVVPTLMLDRPSLSFEDEVVYNVYFSADDLTDVVQMGLVTFDAKLADGAIEDATGVFAGYSGADGIYMARTGGIPAKQLGDTVYFKVYAKLRDGSYVYSDIAGYNAVAYARSVLESSQSDDLKRLVVAMLGYGSQAQSFFGYHTESLMDAILTDQQKASIDPYDCEMMDKVVDVDVAKIGDFVRVDEDFEALYPSVSFDGAFAINFYAAPSIGVDNGLTMYYWDMDTVDALDVLTLSNATGSMEMTALGGMYWGRVAGIAAKEMDKTYYMTCVFESGGRTVTAGIIPYSLGGYCDRKAAADGDAQQAFAQATAVYGYYADRYFASIV